MGLGSGQQLQQGVFGQTLENEHETARQQRRHQRERGFSVVAPISVTVPSSTSCSSPSCCARLKRWISSMNRIGRRPAARNLRASLKASRTSATPDMTAESAISGSPTAAASRRAKVVLPQPGGPHRMTEDRRPAASIRPSGASGFNTSSWPSTSSSRRGRMRSASGRSAAGLGADSTAPAAPNRSVTGRLASGRPSCAALPSSPSAPPRGQGVSDASRVAERAWAVS